MCSFLTDSSVTLDLFPLSMGLSHRITISHNFFFLSHSDLFYSTVEIIWRAIGVCLVNFSRRDNSSHAIIRRLVYLCCLLRCNILNAQHQPYVFIKNQVLMLFFELIVCWYRSGIGWVRWCSCQTTHMGQRTGQLWKEWPNPRLEHDRAAPSRNCANGRTCSGGSCSGWPCFHTARFFGHCNSAHTKNVGKRVPGPGQGGPRPTAANRVTRCCGSHTAVVWQWTISEHIAIWHCSSAVLQCCWIHRASTSWWYTLTKFRRATCAWECDSMPVVSAEVKQSK